MSRNQQQESAEIMERVMRVVFWLFGSYIVLASSVLIVRGVIHWLQMRSEMGL